MLRQAYITNPQGTGTASRVWAPGLHPVALCCKASSHEPKFQDSHKPGENDSCPTTPPHPPQPSPHIAREETCRKTRRPTGPPSTRPQFPKKRQEHPIPPSGLKDSGHDRQRRSANTLFNSVRETTPTRQNSKTLPPTHELLDLNFEIASSSRLGALTYKTEVGDFRELCKAFKGFGLSATPEPLNP